MIKVSPERIEFIDIPRPETHKQKPNSILLPRTTKPKCFQDKYRKDRRLSKDGCFKTRSRPTGLFCFAKNVLKSVIYSPRIRKGRKRRIYEDYDDEMPRARSDDVDQAFESLSNFFQEKKQNKETATELEKFFEEEKSTELEAGPAPLCLPPLHPKSKMRPNLHVVVLLALTNPFIVCCLLFWLVVCFGWLVGWLTNQNV